MGRKARWGGGPDREEGQVGGGPGGEEGQVGRRASWGGRRRDMRSHPHPKVTTIGDTPGLPLGGDPLHHTASWDGCVSSGLSQLLSHGGRRGPVLPGVSPPTGSVRGGNRMGSEMGPRRLPSWPRPGSA